tara:strand:- start:115 stop:522 length:408 start_codon:yes stop_codon:yes gene_type:complete
VTYDAGHVPRRGLSEVLAIGMQHYKKKHAPPDAPTIIEYTLDQKEAHRLLNWMHTKLSWNVGQTTYSDIVFYLSGKNRLWDKEGIKRLEKNVEHVFRFLKGRFITNDQYNDIKYRGFKYISEYAYSTVINLLHLA